MTQEQGSQKQNKRKPPPSYMKYSGMAIQMGVIIFVGAYLGLYLDGRWNSEPWMTLFLSLFSIFAAFYITLKDLM